MSRSLLLRALCCVPLVVLATAAGTSARPLQHPDGPDCDARLPGELGTPFKTGLSFIQQHGLRFGFSCDGIYKNGVEYQYATKAPTSDTGDEGDARAHAAATDDPGVDPDTTWPIDSKYVLKGKITMSSALQHALGLSSNVAASGTLTGPKPFDDTSANAEYDSWTLALSPAFKAALKRKKVAFISLDYTLDVTLPAITAYASTNSGKVLTQKFGQSVVHFSNGDNDFKFDDASRWTPKCKTLGQDYAAGCPGE